MFKLFDHKADVGVKGVGSTPEEAFAECAKAMFSVMADLKKVEVREWDGITVEAKDAEALLVEFLNELLYLKDVNEKLYSRFYLYITGGSGNTCSLVGKAGGEKIDAKKHKIKTEVKAASYHQLKVTKEAGKWIAQCVVDV